MIVIRPAKPPPAVRRRRLRSESEARTDHACPMKAPIAIAAAIPPAAEKSTSEVSEATGSTPWMLPAKDALVARRTRQVCD